MNKTKEVHYVFDLQGKVLEEIDVTNRKTISSVFLKSRHLARVSGDETLYYGTDHQGTTVLVTDETGEAVWSAESSPFGDHVMGGIKIREDLKLKYTGKDYDEDTDLYYFNARWYDASTGRFITEDPARDGQNWYNYVRNNPLKFIDPTGLYTDEKSKDSGDDYEHSQSAAGKKEIERGDRERKEKEKIKDNFKKLKELEENSSGSLKDRIRIGIKRQQIRNQLKALAESGSDLTKEWIKANTEINIYRNVHGVTGTDPFDGHLSVDFLGASLYDTRIHSWADAGGTTIPDGTYEGILRGDTYLDNFGNVLTHQYAHAIWLSGNSISKMAAVLIHSDVFPGYGPNPHQSLNINAPGKPYSEACQITPGVNFFVDMTDTLKDVGFQYGVGDKIKVNIRSYGVKKNVW